MSLATDAGGGLVFERRFLPYGDPRWQEGALPTDFGFGGQRHDGSTGLVFMHARYYHPALGRFVSADTIVPEAGNPQDFNRYAYVRNNPVLYTDPSGHTPSSSRPRPHFGWFKSDWAGRAILLRYLIGGPDWEVDNSLRWTRYMESNPYLKHDMRSEVTELSQGLYQELQSSGALNASIAIYENFSQEIENGESIIGYQYLHGTDANAGGFEIEGSGRIDTMYKRYLVELNISFTWHDIIDPNYKYTTDTYKAGIAEKITGGRADPYEIHITWNERVFVWLDENGNVTQIAGWPGDIPACPSCEVPP